MDEIRRSWRLAAASEEVGDPAPRIARALVSDLDREIAEADDDDRVTITAGMLRELLAPHRRGPVEATVSIDDPDRRVTYRPKIGRAEGRVWLRSVEVIPHDEQPDPSVFRIPVQSIADAAVHALAVQATVGEPGEAVVYGEPLPAPGVPTPVELRELIREGHTRATLAMLYDRSTSRVDDWLREARATRPDLDWPKPRRGPKPGTKKKTTPSGRAAGAARRRGRSDREEDRQSPEVAQERAQSVRSLRETTRQRA